MTVEVVKPQFDANQQFQLDAIKSVVELFAGAEADEQGFMASVLGEDAALATFNEPVYGNALRLSPRQIFTVVTSIALSLALCRTTAFAASTGVVVEAESGTLLVFSGT